MSAEKKSLGRMGNLSNLMNDTPVREGVPMQVPVNDIRPDPKNIRNAASEKEEAERKAFVEGELGPDVKDRGVKSPISLRSDPDAPGKYIINAGQNRWEASIWAGKETVPAFIDEEFTDFDNAKENTKRLQVTGMQLARFIQTKEREGMNKKDIAKGLGVSPSLVNQLSNLLKMPQCIEHAYEEGRLTDLTTIAELMTVYKTYEPEVISWMAEQAEAGNDIRRGAVKALRSELEEPKAPANEPDGRMREDRGAPGTGVSDPNRESSSGGGSGSEAGGERDPKTVDFLNGKPDSDSAGQSTDSQEQASTSSEDGSSDAVPPRTEAGNGTATNADPEKFRKAIIQVRHDDRPGRLILDRRPPSIGWAWVKYDDDGHEFEADLATVQLISLVEG